MLVWSKISNDRKKNEISNDPENIRFTKLADSIKIVSHQIVSEELFFK